MQGESSISIGPLKIWILGRQFPNSQDYWDGNWLNATALCEGEGSRVKTTGAFIHLGELQKWKEDLLEFQCTRNGSVKLPAIEPTLQIKFVAKQLGAGHLDCEVELTGDHLSESHRFHFETDQSYLPGLISQLSAVLCEYPIQGKE